MSGSPAIFRVGALVQLSVAGLGVDLLSADTVVHNLFVED